MIERKPFGEYELITIRNDQLEVSITSLGATITKLFVDGKNVLLGFETPEEYLTASGYLGALVGRYANRIKDASFELNGKKYLLTANEKGNQLHGGINAFDKQKWDVEIVDDNTVKFSLFSKDGENGYPGNLTASATYHIDNNVLRLEFGGTCDQDTIYAPTTHMYFNLGNENILDTDLMINADYYLAVDEENIPIEKEECAGAFDFHQLRKIKQDYDHCFILNGEDAVTAVGSEIALKAYTDYPGIQLYTGSHLKNGYQPNAGFAIEPEFFPNTPNRKDFPSAVLKAGEVYKKYIEYHFERKK